MNKPTVLGVDLSLTATGIALPAGGTTTVRTRTEDGDHRLNQIINEVIDALAGSRSTLLVVIEDLPIHARSAGITGMVHGAVRAALNDEQFPYALVPPATLKKYATGRGNATKPDMRMALYRRAGIDLRDDNQADAWWLRAMGLDHLGHPPVDLPKAQREALAKVYWPALEVPDGD